MAGIEMMRRIASTGGDWAPRCRRRLGGGAEARPRAVAPGPAPGRGRRRASSESVHNKNSESIRRFMCHQMSITLRDQHVNTAVCAGHALFYHRVLSTDVTTTSDGGTHATYRIHIHTTGRRPRTITSHPHKVTDTYVQMWHHSRVNSASGTTLQGGESCSHASRRL